MNLDMLILNKDIMKAKRDFIRENNQKTFSCTKEQLLDPDCGVLVLNKSIDFISSIYTKDSSNYLINKYFSNKPNLVFIEKTSDINKDAISYYLINNEDEYVIINII